MKNSCRSCNAWSDTVKEVVVVVVVSVVLNPKYVVTVVVAAMTQTALKLRRSSQNNFDSSVFSSLSKSEKWFHTVLDSCYLLLFRSNVHPRIWLKIPNWRTHSRALTNKVSKRTRRKHYTQIVYHRIRSTQWTNLSLVSWKITWSLIKDCYILEGIGNLIHIPWPLVLLLCILVWNMRIVWLYVTVEL